MSVSTDVSSTPINLYCNETPSVALCSRCTELDAKAHASYRFKPETAYLSVSYFHCFILSRPLQQGKGWPLQLLAVACLSLAAKLEETRVPSLLEIHINERIVLEILC
ncbi:hypothetical protein POPTR_014G005550v4 [Populus trichocarpa]|uniref:B-like cyclin n=1 Tax=Populus trichocarpa TaxID=3694 RepID=A0A3N7FZR1_POPTR|nr:cyclin-D1-1-like [Populus trichocarpa]RQO99525.1 hypothetical protein POPTR_014G005550v4 [Populus trichocarpa]|eukprot:XP_024440209.1 cyclin-D1-1-like [Populus trichocarpa]